MLIDLLERLLKESAELGVGAAWLAVLLSVLTLIVLAFIANFIAKKLILRVVQKIIAKTPITWDDALLIRASSRVSLISRQPSSFRAPESASSPITSSG